jgi:hypothetical protein
MVWRCHELYPPIQASRKNGLCSPTLQAFPILHFVLLPIFNCNTFLLQCSYTIWHIASLVPHLQRANQHTKHSNKKDSHSNHHHHSFIAVQKLAEVT